MKVREFGTWPPRNGLGAERQKLYDPYNLSFKKERIPEAKEYASSDIEEYYRVPEMKDMTGNPYEQSTKTPSKKRDQSTMKRRLMLRQVVGLLVGSVVIATTYQAMAEQQKQPEPPAIIEPSAQPGETDAALIPNWKWAEDKQTVILELFDSEGNLIKEIPAVVTVSDEEATCNKEGTRTFTATVEDESHQYTDSQIEALPPLGHAFDEGKATVLESGQSAITFECTRCHEQFTVATDMTENDN